MKKFQFRYESILKLRIDKEDEVKNTLAQKIKELKLMEDELERLRQEEHAFLEQVDQRLAEGCTLEELRRYEQNKTWMKSESENLLFYISSKEKEIIQTRKELVEATKQKKIMEKLKEQEMESYQKDEQAAEDKLTDQIVTYRGTSKQG